MAFIANLNNISVISVLLVEEWVTCNETMNYYENPSDS
jgi:hypothetical protein